MNVRCCHKNFVDFEDFRGHDNCSFGAYDIASINLSYNFRFNITIISNVHSRPICFPASVLIGAISPSLKKLPVVPESAGSERKPAAGEILSFFIMGNGPNRIQNWPKSGTWLIYPCSLCSPRSGPQAGKPTVDI